MSRPTIISASWARLAPAAGARPATRPSRRTTTSSQSSSTSGSLWLMKMMPFPSARRRRRIVQKIGDFAWREIGRRLVKDQEISFAQYGLENLDALLAAERQIADACKGIEVETEPSARLADAIRHFRRAQHTAGRRPAEHDVLHHRHGIDQHEMLMDHRDAGGDRVARGDARKARGRGR